MITLPTPQDIETAAKEAGLTMYKVCQAAKVSQANFSRWKGGSKIHLDTVDRLIKAIERLKKK